MWVRVGAGLAAGAAISWFAFWYSWTSNPHGDLWLWLVLPGIYVLEGVNRFVGLPDEVNFVLILLTDALLWGALVAAVLFLFSRSNRRRGHSKSGVGGA